MPEALRYLIYAIMSIGLFFLAIAFFWVFLIIIGVIIVGRLIYMKLFNKGSGSVTVYSYTFKGRPGNPSGPTINADEQEYTTVIDADDMDKEYKVPKLK